MHAASVKWAETLAVGVLQIGKDAVRVLLLALSINEACRLRPRSIYDGVTCVSPYMLCMPAFRLRGVDGVGGVSWR